MKFSAILGAVFLAFIAAPAAQAGAGPRFSERFAGVGPVQPQRSDARPTGTVIFVTPQAIKRPDNIYRRLTLKADPLLGTGRVVSGYSLDGLLEQRTSNLSGLLSDGFLLTIRARAGGAVRVPLKDIYGQGGVLAYAEEGRQQWQEVPRGYSGASAIYR